MAGAAAQIQSVNVTLRSWPEGCRVILLASADRNVSGGTWGHDLVVKADASDGAGALNALNAVQIARTRASRNNAPLLASAWDVGSPTLADIDATTKFASFRYHVKVPASAGIHTVKIALAWDSKITLDAAGVAMASTLANDLDLIVLDNNGLQVASSASYDNMSRKTT